MPFREKFEMSKYFCIYVFYVCAKFPTCTIKRTINSHIGWTSQYFLIDREPGPCLRMFSAKFFHYHFLLSYAVGHRKFVMTIPNSGPFALREPKKTFSCLKLCIFKYCVTVASDIDIETPYLAESIFR